MEKKILEFKCKTKFYMFKLVAKYLFSIDRSEFKGKVMKKVIFVMFAVMIVLGASVSMCSAAVSYDPEIKVVAGTSTNWSGYAVLTNLASPQKGAVTDVKGSWTVPAVTAPATGNTYSAFWIGIDGYSSGTVEQIGTSSDTSSGKTSYYAWYEMYPKYPVTIPLTIKAGEQISAEVKYIGTNKFTLTINDVTSGKSWTTTQKTPNAQRSSAEWIAEAPSSRSGVLPLANFGTVYFTGCTATLNGVTQSIDYSGWQNDPITMVGSVTYIKATLSGLSDSGTASSFSITWKNP
jgi:hypothetical protein